MLVIHHTWAMHYGKTYVNQRTLTSKGMLCACVDLFFLRYKQTYPLNIVHERAFLKLMAYFLKPMMERNVCCCVYHVEVMLIIVALTRMRDRRLGIHNHDTTNAGYCFYDTCCPPGSYGANRCRDHLLHFIGSTDLWQSCMCVKGEMDL
jgi:hypothetical protein